MKKEVKLAKIITFLSLSVTIVSVTFFIANLVLAASWQPPTTDPPEGNPPGFIYGFDNAEGGPQDANINISGTAKVNDLEVSNNSLIGQDIIVQDEICFDDNSDENCIGLWTDLEGILDIVGIGEFWDENIDLGYLYNKKGTDQNNTVRVYHDGRINTIKNSDWIEMDVDDVDPNDGASISNAIIRWGDDKTPPNGPDNLVFQFYNSANSNTDDIVSFSSNVLGSNITLSRGDTGLWNWFALPTPVYSSVNNREDAVWQFGLLSGATSMPTDRFYIGRASISVGDFAVFRDGNVGIGIAENVENNRVPSQKLEVAGNIKLDNTIVFPKYPNVEGISLIKTENDNRDLAVYAQQNLYLLANEQPYGAESHIGDVIISKDSPDYANSNPFLTVKSLTGNVIVNGSTDSGNGKFQIYGPGSGGSEITIIDSSPQIKFVDTDNSDYWIYNNSDRLYFLWDEGDDGDWDSPYPLYFYGRDAWFGEKVTLRGADGEEQLNGTNNYKTKGISWYNQSDNSFKHNGAYLFQYGMGFNTPRTPFNSGAPGRGTYLSGHYGVDLFVGASGTSNDVMPTLSVDKRGTASHAVAINPRVSSINTNALARAALDIHHDLCLTDTYGISECGYTIEQLKDQGAPNLMTENRPFRSSGVPQLLMDSGPDGTIRVEMLGDEASGLLAFTNNDTRFQGIEAQLGLWVVDDENPGGTKGFSLSADRDTVNSVSGTEYTVSDLKNLGFFSSNPSIQYNTGEQYGNVCLGGASKWANVNGSNVVVADACGNPEAKVTIANFIEPDTEAPLLVLDTFNSGDSGTGPSIQFKNWGAGYLGAIAGLDYGRGDLYPQAKRALEFRVSDYGGIDGQALGKDDTRMTLDNWGNLRLYDNYEGSHPNDPTAGGYIMSIDVDEQETVYNSDSDWIAISAHNPHTDPADGFSQVIWGDDSDDELRFRFWRWDGVISDNMIIDANGNVTAKGQICANNGANCIGSSGGGSSMQGWSFSDNYFYDDNEEIIRANDEWLRLNQSKNFTNGVYTPGIFRADGGLQVAGVNITNNLGTKLYVDTSVSKDSEQGLYFNGENQNYAIFREPGSWTSPYPDLRIAFHTGIKLGASPNYNGIRFYNSATMSDLVMSVNDSSTSGNNNVYIANNLGIGVTNPSEVLTIGGSQAGIKLNQRLTKDLPGETLYNDGGDLWWGNVNLSAGSGSSGDDDWTISGSDVYRSTGNVGIGVSSPSQKLHVAGSVRLGDYGGVSLADGNGRISLYSSAFTNTYLQSEAASRLTLHTDGIKFFTAPAGSAGGTVNWSEKMRITNEGNVGIGVTNPSEVLTIGGSQAGIKLNQRLTKDLPGETLYNDGGDLWWGNVNLSAGSGSSGDDDWTISGSDVYRFGNVGINTNYPNADLRIEFQDGSGFVRAGGDSGWGLLSEGRLVGIQGATAYGGWGRLGDGETGVLGTGTTESGTGVRGVGYNGSNAIEGIVAGGAGYSGYFNGGSGVRISGDLVVTGTKNFVQDHPTDPTKEIRYVAMEGGESAVFARGSGNLVNGQAVVNLPEHFTLVSSEQGINVQVTLTSEANGLYVSSKNNKQFIVKELSNGSSDATFDYLVTGIRKGYENFEVIVDKENFPDVSDISASEYKLQDSETRIGNEAINENLEKLEDSTQISNIQQSIQPKTSWWQRFVNSIKSVFSK